MYSEVEREKEWVRERERERKDEGNKRESIKYGGP